MKIEPSSPVRIAVIAAVVGLVGIGGVLFLLSHASGTGSPAASGVAHPVHPGHSRPQPVHPAKPKPVHAKPVHPGKPVHPKPVRPVKPTHPATPVHHPTAPTAGGTTTPTPTSTSPGANGLPPLPREITAALEANKVVVVLLYDPRVKLDQTAFLEASAGADLSHSSFTAVDVSTSDVDSLSARYSVLHDPSILVLKPPSAQLVVKIDGFADRDTVAQAAASAK